MRIAKIYRYPVKSMGGEDLQHAHVAPNGIVGDRRHALLDVETGKIASAKSPKKWGSLLQFSAHYLEEPTPGRPVPPVVIRLPSGGVTHSDSPGVNSDLSSAIGREVRLVTHAPPEASSEVVWGVVHGQEATEWTRQRTVAVKGTQDVVVFELAAVVPDVPGEDSFLDLAPIHVITTSTLRRLAKLSPGTPFDHRRYRPNILLDTSGDDFIEQEWVGRTLWEGPVGMSVLMPTPRCVMSTLAHQEVPASRQTLKAVVKYNNIELFDVPGKWACAGVYASPVTDGEIEVGRSMTLGTAPEGRLANAGMHVRGQGRLR